MKPHPPPCQFCHRPVPADELQTHENICDLNIKAFRCQTCEYLRAPRKERKQSLEGGTKTVLYTQYKRTRISCTLGCPDFQIIYSWAHPYEGNPCPYHSYFTPKPKTTIKMREEPMSSNVTYKCRFGCRHATETKKDKVAHEMLCPHNPDLALCHSCALLEEGFPDSTCPTKYSPQAVLASGLACPAWVEVPDAHN